MAFFRKLLVSIKKKFFKSVRRKKFVRRPNKRLPSRHKKTVKSNRKKFSQSPAKKRNSQRPSKKPAKKIIKSVKSVSKDKKENSRKTLAVGKITHFFSKISVCVIKVTGGDITVGDKLHIKGATVNFIQQVRSLQIENSDVKVAHKGQLVGLKIDKKVHPGDVVSKVLVK